MIEINEWDTPWEAACKLINATEERKDPFTHRMRKEKVFSANKLKRIGKHLISYYDVEEEEDGEI